METLTPYLLIIYTELVAALFFTLFTPGEGGSRKIDFPSILKGMVERIFLTLSLCNGFPHALTLFGALKLGTRLSNNIGKDKAAKYNDYYLLGNLISVSMSIVYYKILQ